MGKGYRNKIRAVDFYCTDKDRKTAYQERHTPQGGWNQPVKSSDFDKLPRSFRKLQFVTGSETKSAKKGEKKGSTSKKGDKKGGSQKKGKEAKSDKEGKKAEDTKAGTVHEFTTKLREGENFRSFQSRLENEKQMALAVQGSALTIPPMNAKRKEALKRRKDRKKIKLQEKEARVAEEEKLEFRGAEKIPFGEVAERPPLLKNLPKALAPPPGIAVLAEFLRKKQASGGDPDAAVKAAEAIERHKLLQARNAEVLKQRSQQAYKEAKRRKVESDRPASSKTKSRSTPD